MLCIYENGSINNRYLINEMKTLWISEIYNSWTSKLCFIITNNLIIFIKLLTTLQQTSVRTFNTVFMPVTVVKLYNCVCVTIRFHYDHYGILT